MLGVAVRGVGTGEQVRLLGARRHAGRGPAALHVDDHHRNLGEVGKPDELLHERDAGSRGAGEGTRAVPAGPDRNADRGELVLRLDDGVAVLAGCGIHPVFLAVVNECFRERGGGCDRVPRANGGAAVDRAECGGTVAIHEDAVSDRVRAPDPDSERARQVLERVIAAEPQRLDVGLQQRFLAFELFRKQPLDLVGIDFQQRRERADVNDVLEQLPLPRVAVGGIADLGERHADDVDVVTELRFRQRLGVIVEQVSAGFDLLDILVPGLRVHRDHQVHAATPPPITPFADAHLVPGRQALDVGRKDVARGDRHAHAQDGAGEQLIRARRARAVDVGELDDEIVDGFDAFHSSAPRFPFVTPA